MAEPEEPLHIPIGEKSSGQARWVAIGAGVVVVGLGGWLWLENRRDAQREADRAAAVAASNARDEAIRAERRENAKSGIPLSEADKPPPGFEPAKHRLPSRELFREVGDASAAGVGTPLPGARFTIRLPPDWEVVRSEGLTTMSAPKGHFRIMAAATTGDDDGDTERALEKIGAVNCNWRKGDGPSRGQLGPGRVDAYFDEGFCGFTDGYGLVWLLRAYSGEHTASLLARYTQDAGEDAEDRLIDVLRTIAPKD
jgi:hypothetical protein